MAVFFIHWALFLTILFSVTGFSLPTDKIHLAFLSRVFSKFVQPGSVEFWTTQSCGENFRIRVIKTTLNEHNMTYIYMMNLTEAVILQYIGRSSLRHFPDHLHRYIMIDICLLVHVTRDLKIVLDIIQRANIILWTGSIFQATSAHQVLCRTIQLIWAPEENVTLLGLPYKCASTNGCSHWRFYDDSSLTRLFPFHIPWLGNVARSSPSLRNAFIRGSCRPNCNISNSILLLSKVYNLTIGNCSPHTSCDFVEHGDRRIVRRLIGTGAFLPLVVFSSQSSAFLAPKGALRPKWEYLSRPFELSVWLGFLSSIAALLCFFLARIISLRPPFCQAITHLRSMFEFLICSFFTPVLIPRKTWTSGILLLIWSLFMQIPATGFRAVMIACLNEPPRKIPISSFSELAAKLAVATDPTILCLGGIVKDWVLFDIFNEDLYTVVDGSLFGVMNKTKHFHAYERVSKIISPKVRYSDCKEYVKNGTGVFFGTENRVRATVKGDTEISWNQFNRLDYSPHIASMMFDNPLYGPLSRSLLWAFESQVETHVDALRHMGHEKEFVGQNQGRISPYTIEDLNAFILLWFCGILVASTVFLLECVVSHSRKSFLRHSVNSIPLFWRF